MLRYLVYDDGVLIRKFASRIECKPFIRSGCNLKVLPKIKNPTQNQIFNGVLEVLGDSPF